MSKITLVAAVVVVLILVGIETWPSVKTLAPTGPSAVSTVTPLIMTGASAQKSAR
jgi:hypothetical protein